jgi:cytochrome d ubiquinol oxidase subunit II
LPTQCQGSFYDVFVGPWNTPFGWATGVFTCLLFAFQGAALLAAELRRHDGALPLIRLARGLHLAAIAWGFLVAGLAWHGAHAWFQAALRNPVSLGCVLLSVLLTPVVAYGFQRGMPWTVRLSTAAQLVCVLIGFFAADYPVLLRQRGGTITLADAAPPAVLASLLVAVGVGLLLILPSLAYLFKVYKLQR